MPILLRPVELTCQIRAESNATEYYSNVLKIHEDALESSGGDSVARMDLFRLKTWIKSYIVWANNWHLENYESGNDITDEDWLKERWPPPKKAPKLKIFEKLTKDS